MFVFYFQGAQGDDPITAGIKLAPMALGMLVASPLAGAWADRYGSRTLSALGMLVSAAALAAMTTLEVHTPYWQSTLWLALVGIGSGMFNSPNTAAMMGAVPAYRRGVAAGARMMLQNTGAVISIAFVMAIITAAVPKDLLLAIFSGVTTGLSDARLEPFIHNMHTALWVLAATSLAGAFVSTAAAGHSRTVAEPVDGLNRVGWGQVSPVQRHATVGRNAPASYGAGGCQDRWRWVLGWLWRSSAAHLMPTELSISLSPEPTAGATARVALRERFGDLLRRATFADLELVVSELVTNAVEHGNGTIRVELTHTDRELRGFVSDRGSGFAYELREFGDTQDEWARAGDRRRPRHAMGHPPRQHAGLVRDQPSRNVIISSRLVRSKMRWTSGRRLHDHEPEALCRGARVLVQEDGDAARREERALGQVDHELLVAGLERGDGRDQVGRGGDVELARDRDGGDRPVAIRVDRELGRLELCRSSGLHPGRDDTQVVAHLVADVRVEVGQQPADHRGGVRAGQLPQHRGEALLAEELAARPVRLGDAVGVEQQPGPGVELRLAGVTVERGGHAERR